MKDREESKMSLFMLENKAIQIKVESKGAELLSVKDKQTGREYMWCGDAACEDKLKDVTGGVKSRCIPFHEETLSDVCVCCGKPAKHMVVFGRQY